MFKWRKSGSDLQKWWKREFTRSEQKRILAKYQPVVMGTGSASPEGDSKLFRPDGSLMLALSALATWFTSPASDLPIARRIADKAMEIGEGTKGEVLDRHFIYQHLINVYYRDRNMHSDSLGLAIQACEKQISLGPDAAKAFRREYQWRPLPSHVGFKQLAIIREHERDYDEIIQLCRRAAEQGWAGDWDKRIARCQKRISAADVD